MLIKFVKSDFSRWGYWITKSLVCSSLALPYPSVGYVGEMKDTLATSPWRLVSDKQRRRTQDWELPGADELPLSAQNLLYTLSHHPEWGHFDVLTRFYDRAQGQRLELRAINEEASGLVTQVDIEQGLNHEDLKFQIRLLYKNSILKKWDYTYEAPTWEPFWSEFFAFEKQAREWILIYQALIAVDDLQSIAIKNKKDQAYVPRPLRPSPWVESWEQLWFGPSAFANSSPKPCLVAGWPGEYKSGRCKPKDQEVFNSGTLICNPDVFDTTTTFPRNNVPNDATKKCLGDNPTAAAIRFLNAKIKGGDSTDAQKWTNEKVALVLPITSVYNDNCRYDPVNTPAQKAACDALNSYITALQSLVCPPAAAAAPTPAAPTLDCPAPAAAAAPAPAPAPVAAAPAPVAAAPAAVAPAGPAPAPAQIRTRTPTAALKSSWGEYFMMGMFGLVTFSLIRSIARRPKRRTPVPSTTPVVSPILPLPVDVVRPAPAAN